MRAEKPPSASHAATDAVFLRRTVKTCSVPSCGDVSAPAFLPLPCPTTCPGLQHSPWGWDLSLLFCVAVWR